MTDFNINPNTTIQLVDIKKALDLSNIIDSKHGKCLELNPKYFKGFGWLLTEVYPFQNITKEAEVYLQEYVKNNDLKKITYLPFD